MKGINNQFSLLRFNISQDDRFPNITLPVLLYKGILDLPWFMPTRIIKAIFRKNHWKNFWNNGVLPYHHYHSKTHEVLGFYKGETMLKLGGNYGETIKVEKGDVLVIPAGIAHKNLGDQNQVKCIGAYPDGLDYDILTGEQGELPAAVHDINNVPLPDEDPIFGENGGLVRLWKNSRKSPQIRPKG